MSCGKWEKINILILYFSKPSAINLRKLYGSKIILISWNHQNLHPRYHCYLRKSKMRFASVRTLIPSAIITHENCIKETAIQNYFNPLKYHHNLHPRHYFYLRNSKMRFASVRTLIQSAINLWKLKQRDSYTILLWSPEISPKLAP